jgi:hypothetical protein
VVRTAELSFSEASVEALSNVVIVAEGRPEGKLISLLLYIRVARVGRQQHRICARPQHHHHTSKLNNGTRWTGHHQAGERTVGKADEFVDGL